MERVMAAEMRHGTARRVDSCEVARWAARWEIDVSNAQAVLEYYCAPCVPIIRCSQSSSAVVSAGRAILKLALSMRAMCDARSFKQRRVRCHL